MGLFDFLKNVGRKTEENTADDIKAQVTAALQGQVDPLWVTVNDADVVHLSGMAVDQAAWEKAILLAGNVDGVARVDHVQCGVAPVQNGNHGTSRKFLPLSRSDNLSRNPRYLIII